MNLGGLVWDEEGKHYYYTGIDAVALYVWDENKSPIRGDQNPSGWFGRANAWSGVTALNESPSGAESNKLYADNIEYLNLLSKEEFGFTLECYQVPDDVYDEYQTLISRGFDWCDGIVPAGAMKVHAQGRKTFGLAYRIEKGSDSVVAGDLGYVYHIIYNAKASPSSRDFATVNDSPEAQTFSYECTTTDLTNSAIMSDYPGVTRLVHLEVDSTALTSLQKKALEFVLFDGEFNSTSDDVDIETITVSYIETFAPDGTGTDAYDNLPFDRMPTPDEIAWACGLTST